MSISIQPKLKTCKEIAAQLKNRVRSVTRPSIDEYIDYLKKMSKRLQNGPLDFVVPNLFRRIISMVRQLSTEEGLEEFREKGFKELNQAISGSVLQRQNSKQDQLAQTIILPAIDSVIEELESNSEEINTFASLHFFTHEVIMVYEYSTTVLKFLLSAEKDVEIIVVESEIDYLGKEMARELAKKKLNVTLIPFTNAFALMQRVNKILLGVDAVLKDGGLLMHPGTYALAITAKQFSVPVIALSGTHKLTPKYAFDQNTFNELLSPLKVNENGIGITYDYVPPEYITMYITSHGQFTPQSIYQLFNEIYHIKDEDI